MLKLLQAMNSFVRALLGLAIVGALAGLGWFGYENYYAEKHALEKSRAQLASLSRELDDRRQEINRLNIDLEARKQEIEKLNATIKLLTLDQRIARIEVLGQEGSQEQGDLRSRLSFVELNEQGQPLEKPKVFTVAGDVAYLDALVVKFDDKYIAEGDPLRSTSVALFRRIFGEAQRPVDGFLLDIEGTQPTAYRRGGKPSEFEQQLWARFWEYANDPVKARREGVRAAHGEAPFIKLTPGKRYRVELRASGGLSVVPEETAAPTSSTL